MWEGAAAPRPTCMLVLVVAKRLHAASAWQPQLPSATGGCNHLPDTGCPLLLRAAASTINCPRPWCIGRWLAHQLPN